MLLSDGDTAWAQYTGTAALSALAGLVTMWFWAKKMWRADRQAEHELQLRERADGLTELKQTAEWQSSVYQTQFDEVRKELVELKNAMKLLHLERNECIKKSAEQDARSIVQEAKIKALEEEIAMLRGVIARIGNAEIHSSSAPIM